MYRIIGADQKEYGPVTIEQLRQWMAEGRVNGQTQVSSNGGAWQPLGTLPEFAGLAAPPLAAALPVVDGAEVARRALRVPAILLIVTGVLSLLGAVAGLLSGPGRLPAEVMGNLPPDMQRAVEQMMELMSSPMAYAVSILMALPVLAAGICMLRLRLWVLAVIGSILGIITCSPCCCLLGPVGGIWGLITLLRSDVKPFFK
jgi:uncharacterized protein YoaH (UPF0181 family)